MKIDFNRQINRKNTDCSKWDGQGGDYIPLWVADMDFPVAEPVLEALKKRLEHPFFGYTFPGESVYQAVISYYKRRYDFDVKKEWILFNHGVNTGNNIAARALGGTIMVATPMYPHINQKLPQEAGKPVIRVPLKQENGLYTFDFEAMEKAVTQDVTTFVLCNPHNPVGRVFTGKELEELFAFAARHDIVVVADEIHSDLILEGEHIPAITLNEAARQRVILHHSASKTYNIPGLPVAFAIIPNEKLRHKYEEVAATMHAPFDTLSFVALEAAFTKGEEWRQELLEYLRENKKWLDERISRIPGLSICHSEGTYLGWIDARETGLSDPAGFFMKEAGVKFNDGESFSAPGFIRVNFDCPRAYLEEAFDKVEKALDNWKKQEKVY